MFLEVRSEQIFRDWITFIRIFFKDTSGRALISSADGVRMEVGSTKLEQVFKQLVNIPCRVFPARVVWDSDILTPTSINDNLFESRHFFD